MTLPLPDDVVEWVDPTFGPGRSPRPVRYRRNELIVELGAVPRVVEALAGVDSPEIETAPGLGLARWKLPPGLDRVPEHVGTLRNAGTALAASASPNYVLQPWVSSGGQGWPEPTTSSPAISDRGAAVATAVFDSGLRQGYHDGHPYLRNAEPVDAERDMVLPGPDNSMELFDCHGMFVAGVLLCGAPAASVRVRKVFAGGTADEWTVAQAIDAYLSGEGADVRLVNLSFGTFAERGYPPAALHRVIAKHEDVLFVAAAGNTGIADAFRPVYPASFDTVVGVGALDRSGRRPAPFSDIASADVWAPGDAIDNAFGCGDLTMPDGAAPRPFGGTARWSGTSFAAPRVCAELTTFLDGPARHGTPRGYRLLAQAAIAWLREEFPGGLVQPARPVRIWPLSPLWPLRPKTAR